MSERDDFLAWVGTTLREAEEAVHDGDAAPRRAIWSTREPVTILGAGWNASGPDEVEELFQRLETVFSGNIEYSHELIAAEVVGDLAYTVGIDHSSAILNGERRDYELRVTQVYRREDGEWKVVHRHGSAPPVAP